MHLSKQQKRNKPLISPSLMCMDLIHFKEQLTFFDSRVDMYHVDIMDGHFVPNLTLSPFFVNSVKKITTKPIDCHLMVEHPENYIEALIVAGAKFITLHVETISGQAFRLIERLRNNNCKVGIVMNPETSIEQAFSYIHRVDKVTVLSVDPGFAGQNYIPEMEDKIRALVNYRQKNNLSFLIEIDGSCNKNTYYRLFEAGVDVFIMGSGLFNADPSINKAWDIMVEEIDESIHMLL